MISRAIIHIDCCFLFFFLTTIEFTFWSLPFFLTYFRKLFVFFLWVKIWTFVFIFIVFVWFVCFYRELNINNNKKRKILINTFRKKNPSWWFPIWFEITNNKVFVRTQINEKYNKKIYGYYRSIWEKLSLTIFRL